MGRRLIANAGWIGPVADADSRTVLRVIDLEVHAFERSGRGLSQIDGHFDDIPAVDLAAGRADPGLLDVLGGTGTEAELLAIGRHANLLDVIGVLASLGVAAVDEHLHGVLLVRIRIGQVDVRVVHLHENIQLAVRPQGLGGRCRLGRPAGHLVQRDLDGVVPRGVRRIGIDLRGFGVGGNLHGFRIAQLFDQRDRTGRVGVPCGGLSAVAVLNDHVQTHRGVLDGVGARHRDDQLVSAIAFHDLGSHVGGRGGGAAPDHVLGVADPHGYGVAVRFRGVDRIHIDGQLSVVPVGVERSCDRPVLRGVQSDQRQALPRRRGAVPGFGPGQRRIDRGRGVLEHDRAFHRFGQVVLIADVTDVGGLTVEVLVEQQRRALLVAPGLVVAQPPHRNREQLVGVPVDDLVDVVVVLSLLDELRLRNRRSGGDVQFGDGLLLAERGHIGQRVVEIRRGRGQRHMELVTDAVKGNPLLDHAFHKRLVAGTLARLLGAVIVDEQRHRMLRVVGGVDVVQIRIRVPERVIDVVLAPIGLIPQRIAHAVGGGVVAVVHGLVDHVERDDGIGRAAEFSEFVGDGLRHVLDVLALAFLHRGLVGKRAAGDAGVVVGVMAPFVGLEEPVGRLRVPDQNMAVDLDAVLAGERQQVPRVIRHAEMMLVVVPAFRLQRVLRGDLVEVLDQGLLLVLVEGVCLDGDTGVDSQRIVFALDAARIVGVGRHGRRSECQRHQHGCGRKRRDDATALGRPTLIGCIEQCIHHFPH